MSFERMERIFFKLLEADSPFYHEKASADIITAFLDSHGIAWQDDGSAVQTGCDTGNIIVAGSGEARLSFCAHMDTIRIFDKKSPVTEGTVVRAAGGSGVLGIDDKSGLALLLELMALLQERGGIPGDVHFLFTTCEEMRFKGAWALENRHFIRARNFVVDSGGVPMARGVSRGVGQISYAITVRGVMAHASSHGGKNAALFSSRLIPALNPGPAGTSSFLHVASVECPGSPNTVPDRALIQGQLLYTEQEEAETLLAGMRDTAESLAREAGLEIDFTSNRDCAPWNIPDDDPLVVYARDAAARAGLDFHLGQTASGSDAQVIAQRGGRVLKISSGMMSPHSAQESIDLEDMQRCLRFLWALTGRDPGELSDL